MSKPNAYTNWQIGFAYRDHKRDPLSEPELSMFHEGYQIPVRLIEASIAKARDPERKVYYKAKTTEEDTNDEQS